MRKRLYSIYRADQQDRSRLTLHNKEKWKRLAKRDKERQGEVAKILRENKDLTASDYYRAAMVFQHASGRAHKRAAVLAKKGMNMGHVKAKWLYAAATDRALIRDGKKQKFGTQFRVSKDGKAIPFQIDKKTTDEMREEYNVPPIEKTKKRIEKYWEGKTY